MPTPALPGLPSPTPPPADPLGEYRCPKLLLYRPLPILGDDDVPALVGMVGLVFASAPVPAATPLPAPVPVAPNDPAVSSTPFADATDPRLSRSPKEDGAKGGDGLPPCPLTPCPIGETGARGED